MKFCSGGKKMRNAWVHQGAMSDVKKKSEQKQVRPFPQKTCNQEVSESFTP